MIQNLWQILYSTFSKIYIYNKTIYLHKKNSSSGIKSCQSLELWYLTVSILASIYRGLTRMHDRGQPRIEGMSLSIMSWSRDRFSLPRFFACLRDYRLTVLVPLVHRDNGRLQKYWALSEEARLIGTYLVLMDLIFSEEYWIYSPATENKRYSLLDGKFKKM